LAALFDEEVSGVIAMLDDDDANADIVRFAAEHHGISRLVVRPGTAAENGRFTNHGALVVHPTTSMVALLAQAVLTPNATSLLLEHDLGREIFQVSMSNPDLDGVAVADLRLPPGVLLLEVRRGNSVLLVDGRTRLQAGDELTLIADDESRAEMQLAFTK
jgi:Trk K+ transport system NAD-binding subunit